MLRDLIYHTRRRAEADESDALVLLSQMVLWQRESKTVKLAILTLI